eukprot:c20114_g1_i1 orf=1-192(-)
MLSLLSKLATSCCLPLERCVQWNDDLVDRQDALLWYNDLGRHATGEFSIATVQANQLLEDQSQV